MSLHRYGSCFWLLVDVRLRPVGGAAANSILYVSVLVGSLPVDALVRSVLLMLLQRPIIKFLVPCAKGCFGEQWRVAVFVVVCAMELPATLLLVDAPISSVKFWLLVVLQEGNALLKHLGIYHQLYCRVVARVGRPVGDDAVQVSDERRRVMAPCDCLAEALAPFVISVYVLLVSPGVRPVVAMGIALLVRVSFTVVGVVIEHFHATADEPSPMSEALVYYMALDAEPRVVVALLIVLALQPALLVIYVCAFV